MTSKNFFRFFIATIVLSASISTEAAICQFIPATGSWDAPGNWANCTGGNGTVANTPGPADRAEITGKTVTLGASVYNVGDIYIGAAIIQGAGKAATTLNIVAGGTIAWASGSYNFDSLTVNFASTGTIPAANGPFTLNSAEMFVLPGTTMNLDTVQIAGTGAQLTNNGTMRTNNITSTAGNQFQNNTPGQFDVTNSMSVDGAFENLGRISVASGQVLTLNTASTFNQSDANGKLTGDGTISATGQTLTLNEGSLAGNLTLNVAALNNGNAVLDPGGPGVIGTLTINGNYVHGATSLLFIEVTTDGSLIQKDQVLVSGTASIGGGDVAFDYIDTGNGVYNTNEGDIITFLTAGSLSGSFTGFSAPATSNITFLDYTPAAAQLVVGPPLAIVTSTADSGPGSLREAIAASNSCDVSDTEILFDLTLAGGTISLATPLPPITCPMKFRGYSNPGAVPNSSTTDWNATLKVTLDGLSCAGCNGLTIATSNVHVEGINFTNWAGAGINISAGDDIYIVGNYFFQGNNGILHSGGGNLMIGDKGFVDGRNIFVHATQAAINTTYNGPGPAKIENNLIGAGAGLAPGANGTGIRITGANGVRAEQNVIANNTKGIAVTGASTTGFSYRFNNKIYGNTVIGVDLNDDGLTANDEVAPPYDTDTGPNGLMNFPTIGSVVNMAPNTRVNFFVKTSANTSTNACFCGSSLPMENQCRSGPICTAVTTDANGLYSGFIDLPQTGDFSLPVRITAFQEPESGPNPGSTSEISPGVNLTAGAPAISVTGSTTFPLTAVGASSGVQTITITNTGSSDLHLLSLSHTNPDIFGDTVNGPPPQSSHWCGFGSDTMGFPLPGGPIIIPAMATCQLVLNFRPNTGGTLNGTITIVSNAPTSPTMIALTGTAAVAPTATLAPDPLNFGNVNVGSTSGPLTATFTNPSATPLTISSIGVGPQFNIAAGGTCMVGNVIAASGGFCTINVTTTPTGGGASSALQVITTPLSNNPQVVVQVNGVASAPTVGLSVGSGTIMIGTSTPLTITLNNASAMMDSIANGSMTLPGGLSVAATPMPATTCGTLVSASGAIIAFSGGSIPPSGSCTVTVPVQGDMAGAYMPTFPIGGITTANGSNSAAATTAVTVVSLMVPTMTVAFSPTTMAVGGSSIMTLTLANPTGSSAFISGGSVTLPAGLVGTPPGTNSCGTFGSFGGQTYSFGMGNIPAMGSCTIDISVTAAAGGMFTVNIAAGALSAGAGMNSNISSATLTVIVPVPVITSPATAAGMIGSPFSYSIVATNSPVSYNASGLPTGLTVNTSTGLISGTPTVAGTFNATVSATNGGGTGTLPVTFTISAVPVPIVSLSQTSAGFGVRTINTTSPVTTVTLTNTGTANLLISAIAGTGGDFAYTSTCPISTPPVLPAGTCTFDITFTPLTAAALTGSITITSNAAGSPHVISLSGTGVPVPVPNLTLGSGSLAFGNVSLATASAENGVLVTNSGFATLSLTGITITGAGFARVAPSSGTPPDCGTSVAPGANCQVALRFTPTVLGPATGQISFASNAAGSPHLVSLTATGVSFAQAAINVATSLEFASQIINTASAGRALAIDNTGNAALSVSSVSLGGTNAADFTFAGDCSSVAAGGNCSLIVTFTPRAIGVRSALLTIVSDAGGTTTTSTVQLTGSGILAPSPIANLSVTSIGYGNNIFGGATPNQVVTLRNTGGVALSIASVFTIGDFFQTNGCPSSLAAGASCVINVQFSPLGVGNRSGELQVLSTAAGSPHKVLLSGTGCRWFSQAQSRFFLTSCGN